ncbi:MAG: hypothetical protein V2I43_14590 [Parvularcula sp.]|jgi:hypothetical protein|nr:hypothetical protein [Parvularcula sp.]
MSADDPLLAREVNTRTTIYDMPRDATFEQLRTSIPDAGRRRLLSWGMDFDTRAMTLGMKIEEHWEAQLKQMWAANQKNIRTSLIAEFGEQAIDQKVENFLAIGAKPMSVLAYHNRFFEQVRRSFVMADYYPALVGACALGERILNHLILDMRESFKGTTQYKQVYRKNSFDRWEVPIDTLEAWGILLPEAAVEFRALKILRHRSIHFSAGTYSTLREDSLAAIIHMRTIIEQQFGSHGVRPWFISGTKGHIFIKKEWENHPFILTYFVPNCPFVGPLFGMAPDEYGAWNILDKADYGDGEWTDEEFAREYDERDPELVVTSPPQGR